MNRLPVTLCCAFALLCQAVSHAPARAAAASSSAIRPTIVDWALTPAAIKTSCAAEIARANRELARIAADRAPATFRNTTLAIEDVGSDLGDALVAQTFLESVAPDARVRDASLACSNDVGAFGSDETANPALYRRLAAADTASSHASAADRALSHLWVESFRRSGAGLAPDARKEFVRLSKELTDLQLHFTQNIENDTSTIVITKAQTAGLPADFVATLKATDTGYVVRVTDSTVSPFLDNASDEAARKAYYLAFQNIASPANVVLLQRAIAIRDRLAHLMGFPTWAAYQLDVRVDRSPRHIDAFLDDLDATLLPRARQTVAELTALKVKATGDAGATIAPWDVQYYTNESNKAKYSVDQEEIKRYFPAAHTVDAIMALYEHLLGGRFSQIPNAPSWHSDVTEYAVSDAASGRFLGSFFLDLYAREGKPGGAFNAAVLPVRRLTNGAYRPPICAMVVSDWPATVAGQPVLLTHDDVTTFFHEFGHNMAALLTTAPYESLTQFQQDFVEAPSQMLENFTWDPNVLRKISSNVDTGAPLPDATIAKLVASRCATDRLCNAYAAVRQLEFSIIDMDYHSAGPNVDTTAVLAEVARDKTPLALVPGTHPQASFSHLMGGYDAGYYTYLWSLVYAQDMFTAFQKGGLDNPAGGMRYRETILVPGRTYDPNREVRAFLGRPMSTAAFYQGFANAP
ncbi:MAG: Zn-dependent oligopeptidase [Candidatus Eremiobacteraeota bacterium]|nr:Zn-dependent oligopeptidase [Candidatus Eremiobacteraeota bacterium]